MAPKPKLYKRLNQSSSSPVRARSLLVVSVIMVLYLSLYTTTTQAADNESSFQDTLMQGAKLPLQQGDQQASANAEQLPTQPAPPSTTSAASLPVTQAPAAGAPQSTATSSQPIASVPLIRPPSPAAVVQPPSAASDLEGRLNALNSQLDSLRQSLDRMVQELTEVQAKATQLPANNSSSGQLSLDSRLDKIENQLNAIQAKSAAEKPVAVRTTSAHRRAPPAINKAHPITATKVKKQNNVSDNKHWVLRAATPDTAWISATAETPDLVAVRVGDKAPGIGEVRAIRQEDDNWVIVGTAGTIH